MLAVVIILIVIIVAVGLVAITQYNSLVGLRNKLQESWRQVDVELNRRYDLVPNLVSTVQGSAQFERSTLDQVISLRNQAKALAGGGGDPSQRAQVEGDLGRALGNIVVTAEAYPDLKTSAGFQQLQAQLSQTEDRIANSRRYYNAIVGQYNTRTESFPSNILANMLHFTRAGYFEVDDPSIRQTPTVDFSGLNAPAAPQAPSSPSLPSPQADELPLVQPPAPTPQQQFPPQPPQFA